MVRYVCLSVLSRTSGTSEAAHERDLLAILSFCDDLYKDGTDVPLGTDPNAFAQAMTAAYPRFEFSVDCTGTAPVAPTGWQIRAEAAVPDGTRVRLTEDAHLCSTHWLPSGQLLYHVEERNTIVCIGAGGGGPYADRLAGRTYVDVSTGGGSKVGLWDASTQTTGPTQYWGRGHLLCSVVVPAAPATSHASASTPVPTPAPVPAPIPVSAPVPTPVPVPSPAVNPVETPTQGGNVSPSDNPMSQIPQEFFQRAEYSVRLCHEADAAVARGDWKLAREDYNLSNALLPGYKPAQYGLAESAAAAGNTASSLDWYRHAIYARYARPGTYGTIPGDGYQENDAARLMEFVLALSRAGHSTEALAVYHRSVPLFNTIDGHPNRKVPLPDFAPGGTVLDPRLLQAMAHAVIAANALHFDKAKVLRETEQAASLAPDSAIVLYYEGSLRASADARDTSANDILRRAASLGDPLVRREAEALLQRPRS